MKPIFSRITGLALIVAAVMGLGLSLAGLVLLGGFSSRISTNLQSTLEYLDRALAITSDGLETAESSLQAADSGVGPRDVAHHSCRPIG